MKNILYVVAVILIIVWAIGFLAYSVGAIIHLLLLLAMISFLVRILSRNKRASNNNTSLVK